MIACFASNVFANLVVGDPLLGALGLSLCNSLEISIVCAAMRRWCKASVDLTDMRTLARFALVGGLVGPALAGLLASLLVSSDLGHWPPITWLSWTVTDSLGLLIATPAIMILAGRRHNRIATSTQDLIEHFAVLAIGTLLTALVFMQSQFPFLFLISPFVVVAAFRLGPVGTAISTILIAIVSSIATSAGSGPIQLVHGDLTVQLLILQLFLAVNFGMGLPIAAALETRERLRNELAESRDFIRSILERMEEIVFRTDADGSWTYLNPAWEVAMGMSVEDCLGKKAVDFVHPDDRPAQMQATDVLASGQRTDGRIRLRFINAESVARQMEINFRGVYSADTGYAGSNGSMSDVTDHEEAEAKLKQAQATLIHVSRLSAMGAMASTLAHELNQPLAAVANYARGLKQLIAAGEWSAPRVLTQTLDEIDLGVVRAGDIVRRLRAMVERGEIERTVENLPLLIEEACAIGLIDASEAGVSYNFGFDPSATSVFVDRVQIQQVLINLLRNAVEAMTDCRDRQILISTRLCDAFCEVTVHDSGKGIREDMRAGLFTPFNGSKDTGLGVGLSISRTIIEAHGGQIWVEEGLVGGAAFKMTLPVHGVQSR